MGILRGRHGYITRTSWVYYEDVMGILPGRHGYITRTYRYITRTSGILIILGCHGYIMRTS